MAKAHPEFKSVQNKIAKKEGVSKKMLVPYWQLLHETLHQKLKNPILNSKR